MFLLKKYIFPLVKIRHLTYLNLSKSYPIWLLKTKIMIVKLAEGNLKTKYGIFKECLYYDGQKEAIAFFMGDLQNAEDVLCRVHSSCIFGHYFNSIECDCQEQMDVSQQLIQQAGQGIIILLDQEGKGNGHFALLNSVAHKGKGVKQADAYEAVGFKKDARDFRSAAKILQDLGVQSIRMLTNNEKKVRTLSEFGIEVKGTREIKL
jgi:GTP cyclohydrolase II